jgi:ABC-type antimicrobial peptide transport system permease subunit
MEQVVGRGHSRQRFALVLMGAFAAVAVILAALGLYGVLDYGVRQRAREIGIRVALGATGAEIRRLVLKQAAVILGAGLAAGAVGALLLGRWLSSLLFEVSPSDPRVFAATALVLAITGAVAAWLPARRAARLPPTVALQGS